ncbi:MULTISPECIES: hypothetical protein [unclassified Micromonospora]|uniref:hypothetical protein n=1 Tax=unclassified Micromonospora TaxID=2617518 RepID=UPI0022B70A4C|nr:MULTISPECIES: hypothetical protein [unclassified Micromonospora]MCZ7422028.1 hypothetical protein [Verrucosispora sp. WMMA2121]WBB93240.1 hypothetical protein O7597_09830 [Verrucosispora sp. WMMC514]
MSRPTDGERTPEDAVLHGVARRLDKPMGALGVLFVLVVLGQALAGHPTLSTALTVLGWVLWAVFVAEFALRAWLARHDARRFWRRNWWQIIFLAVPFLRFARAASALRAARAGGVITAAVRGSRSAGRLLTDRIAWLAIITTTVVLSVGQLLVVTGSYRSYGPALHDVALATITGEPLGADDPFAQVVELVLAIYSVVVFGTLAGAFGAFFLSAERERKATAT